MQTNEMPLEVKDAEDVNINKIIYGTNFTQDKNKYARTLL